ncbi:hypothetical protein VV01_14680 [Luteipulveratus halotolerans]|uniref:Uncharacterized protein n=2 Tax=Luteipulveratus halotolerans TaxID=1631356 RepID=A0A0L6CJY0_9MICO|nr:hypothetical protein VV01_14680 [Luteipulveratus halotolerans]
MAGGMVIAVVAFLIGAAEPMSDTGPVFYLGLVIAAAGAGWWLARGHLAEHRARKARRSTGDGA